jgi:aryl-alcohol dehydrogenase-like predicted oxidoreductase
MYPSRGEGRVGGTLEISKVGLGGFEFEDDPDWAGAREVLTAAIDAGIDWLDTAEQYFDGMNELTIGRALRDIGAEMTISTKVAPAPEGSGFAAAQIRKACLTSLERLGVERVDMYLLHWPDRTGVPLQETWTSMRRLVDDGLAGHVGLSNFDREQIERCLAVGPLDLIQEGLSPIDHLETRDLAAWCSERGIAVVTYEPLANGMLAGAIRAPEDLARVVEDYEEWPIWKRLFSPSRFERSEAVADGMRAVADRLGCTIAQVAIAWNLHQPGVTATLAGTRNPAHIRADAAAASIGLTDGDLAELDALIPLGPTFVADGADGEG